MMAWKQERRETRLGRAAPLLIAVALGLVSGDCSSPSKSIEAVLSKDLFGARLVDRIQHYEVAGYLLELGLLLEAYKTAHGKLPETLKALQRVEPKRWRRLKLLSSFYRIVDDQMPEYRYIYRPGNPAVPLVAVPREARAGALSFALHQGQVTAGDTDGEIPEGGLEALDLFSLFQSIQSPKLPLGSDERLALLTLCAVEEAQKTHAYLHGGIYAKELSELTRPHGPGNLPLLDPETAEQNDGSYQLSLGGDGRGWWAKAKPKEEVSQSRSPNAEDWRYKFRVGEDIPLAFAPAVGEGRWRPISELP